MGLPRAVDAVVEPAASSDDSARPERILELSDRLSRVAGGKISEIAAINRHARMLSINAMIEASRAGASGRGFAVVADEMKNISLQIEQVAGAMQSEVRADLDELSRVGGAILSHLRGQRLADLSLNAIDIIDRNLYERTCDVRWWATDSAVVECAAQPARETAAHASDRLGVILSAYTVYLDLWICGLDGKVIASGRPGRYPAVSQVSVAEEPWFKAARATRTGDEFAVNDIARVGALGDAPVATYAAAIRAGGRSNGKVIGVLGAHFDWEPQARAVVEGVRLAPEERDRSRVLLLDAAHRVIAASDGRGLLEERFPLQPNGAMGSYEDGETVVGYALTPGYETYRGLGWYACIVQRLTGG
jgi:hypothetical protein